MKLFVWPIHRFVPMAKYLVWFVVLTACLANNTKAQSLPKTSDITEDVASDGSVNMAFQMTFDAAPWRAWKAMVGDEPARLRAMMRHQFAAFTLEDFKLERDDMNRVAKMSMRSPVGPELRDDGSFQVPVDGYFRLVNSAGHTWYFSGINPNAGNSLNNVKVTLPTNAVNAYVANPNNSDQALVFALVPLPSPSRWYYLAGGIALSVGIIFLLAGILTRQRAQVLSPVPPRALSRTGTVISVPPVVPEPVVPGVPAVPPSSEPVSPRQSAQQQHDQGRIYSEPD